jgi:hypothetical protein
MDFLRGQYVIHGPVRIILSSDFVFGQLLTVNIAAMLLNLDPDIVRSGLRLHSTCSKKISSFITIK